MYIKFQTNKNIEGTLKTFWYVFETKNKNYTNKLAEKVKNYIIKNINPSFENTSIESIKGWYTGKYDKLTYIEEWNQYELERDNTIGTINAEFVIIIDIDRE